MLARVDALAGHDGPLDVYAAVGGLEETAPDRVWPQLPADPEGPDARMVANVHDLVAALRGLHRPGLTVSADVLRGEHHITRCGRRCSAAACSRCKRRRTG